SIRALVMPARSCPPRTHLPGYCRALSTSRPGRSVSPRKAEPARHARGKAREQLVGDADSASPRAGPGRDFVVFGAATLIAQALSFVVLAVMARRLGPEPIGAYAFAITVAAYFAIPANFGLTALATRDVARDPSRMQE